MKIPLGFPARKTWLSDRRTRGEDQVRRAHLPHVAGGAIGLESGMSLPRFAIAAVAILFSPTFAIADSGVSTGCATGQTFSAGSITVTGAFIPAPPKGAATAAAYMSIANSGDADTLTGATSPVGALGLHQMTQKGSVMEMTPVEGGLRIPAHGSVSLNPMSYHLMMTGMSQRFSQGQCVSMILHFAKAGDLAIELNVGALGSKTAPGAADASQPMEMSGMGSMPGM